MNIGMVSSLNSSIEEAENKYHRVTGVLGIAFGKKHQVDSKIQETLIDFNSKAYVGKEYWELITGNPNFYSYLLIKFNELKERGKTPAEVKSIVNDENKVFEYIRDTYHYPEKTWY